MAGRDDPIVAVTFPIDPMRPPLTLHLADCDAWRPEAFAGSLSVGESARAERFLFALDRDRYIVRRGLLRRLLADRIGCRPDEVPLTAGLHGKPFLGPAAPADRRPAFNLSRSGGLALYALADAPRGAAVTGPAAPDGPAIGVDLERIDAGRRTVGDLRRIADHFAPQEARLLAALPDDRATLVFYRLWTGKEACLKCLGTGIGGDGPTLADVVVDLDADGGLLGSARSACGLTWRVEGFEPCPGHAAAVAVRAGPGTEDRIAIAPERLEPASDERRVSRGGGPPPGPFRGAP